MNNITHWLMLVLSLPTSNATARMRVWRALKNTGCGVLRDGVYLLPDNTAASINLHKQATEVIDAGGTAQVVKFSSTHSSQDVSFRELFDRTDDYAALKHNIDMFIATLPSQNLLASNRTLKRLARDFAALSAIDFFAGEAREQVGILLDKASTELSVFTHPDEPRSGKGKIKKLKLDNYQKRIWATRKKLWIDRMASAWLIKRFIDPAAKFKWLNRPQDCPRNALGFDFDGATFTHVGSLVTFEVLLASFSLEIDPALQRLASVVHYLDVGGIPVAESYGLELVFKGIRKRCNNDDELLYEAAVILDDLYQTYINEEKQI